MTDVLFVHVPGDWRFPAPEWCLGFRYLMSALRDASYDASIAYPPMVTDGTAQDRLVQQIVDRSPRLVGLTAYDATLPGLLAFVDKLRRAGSLAHITVGGLAASMNPSRLIAAAPGVDSVVRGEGERTVAALADVVVRGVGSLPIPGVTARTEVGVLSGPPRPFVTDLDGFADPVWDDVVEGGHASLVRYSHGCVPVVASRGCYGRCSFCCIERFYRSAPGSRPWRKRSPTRVVDDVVAVTTATGVGKVTFVDENFIGPGKAGHRHAVDVATELARRCPGLAFNLACRPDDVDPVTFSALKAAGLAAVTLGIESMSASSLRLFHKNVTPEGNAHALTVLDELGVQVEITFIFFHPLMSLVDVRDNLAFVAAVATSRTAYFNSGQPFTELVPLPGTALTAALQEQGFARRTALSYDTTMYADPRVRFLAERATSVPLTDLGALARVLPHERGGRVAELRNRIDSYHRHLALNRIPELLAELCDRFEAGAGMGDYRVTRAVRELEAESDRIRSLIDQFARHAA